ncbi:WecB/TagA/CpsF family glycosyltransferase [Spongisporangium articulatum]|uniref:WecB/TagA/CpsF family glycosyltransferase n=1 Tax=Spongisporangium articulatum TaxID=3362603 RepID=A0ABW8AT61_9ACTN
MPVPRPRDTVADALPQVTRPRAPGGTGRGGEAPVVLHPAPPAPSHPKVRIGRAELACVSMAEALDDVRRLALGPDAALVVTANADHVVRMQTDEGLAAAYAAADLALIDGQPLAWTARLMAQPTPRVAGVDLFETLCASADSADSRLRLFLLGGSERNSAAALSVLRERHPALSIVGRNTDWVTPENSARVVDEIRSSGANVVAVFFGCPKQERWVHEHRDALPAGAYLCLGGTVDIVSGALPRAGRRWQALGLEWLHRLMLEPRRLWRRYLVADLPFALIALRSVRASRRHPPP